MNTRFLEAFVWVARLGSFRSAAERLHLTPATISGRIASLESDFNKPLFERDAREIRLTPAGRILLTYADRMLDVGREMRMALQADSPLTGVLRIGVIETIVHTWLIDFLNRLQAGHQDLEIELTAESTQLLHERLKRGQLDVTLQTDPVLGDGISNLSLGQMPMCVIGRMGDGWRTNAVHSFTQLSEQPFLTMTRGSQPHLGLLDACRKEGASPKTVHCIGSLAAILRLVRAGIGIAVIPAAAIREELQTGSLVAIPTTSPLPPLRLTVSYRQDPRTDANAIVATLASEEAERYAATVGPQMALPAS
ncbi:LysR family transcriptional regulator [Telmatospirillum sp.]|uniref:LysR family transcriptional regulator n=1 Tax=Telmatospirillum sp. TaxID=2079197 RepID=UPI00284BE55F|nr:LysR family transcriptional regulator [Telmatospirillum sp.]MDR3440311.1 LysR family transcriptional regulator [Telmatospirillum sp.]